MELDPFIGGGNVAYCNANSDCHIAYTGDEPDEEPLNESLDEPKYKVLLKQALRALPKPGLKFPNGLTRGFDGLIYLPGSVDGLVRVLAITDDKKLKLIDSIPVGMPLDNISPDATGDLYVPGFPSLLQCQKGMTDPYNEVAPVSIWRIRKTVDIGPDGVRSIDYRVEKVIEDKESKVLAGATTVRHDAKTGRLFVGGEFLS